MSSDWKITLLFVSLLEHTPEFYRSLSISLQCHVIFKLRTTIMGVLQKTFGWAAVLALFLLLVIVNCIPNYLMSKYRRSPIRILSAEEFEEVPQLSTSQHSSRRLYFRRPTWRQWLCCVSVAWLWRSWRKSALVPRKHRSVSAGSQLTKSSSWHELEDGAHWRSMGAALLNRMSMGSFGGIMVVSIVSLDFRKCKLRYLPDISLVRSAFYPRASVPILMKMRYVLDLDHYGST